MRNFADLREIWNGTETAIGSKAVGIADREFDPGTLIFMNTKEVL